MNASLEFLPGVNKEMLQEHSTVISDGTATDGVEAQEPLNSDTSFSQLADLVKTEVNDLLANGARSRT